jgi:hypothetical protein
MMDIRTGKAAMVADRGLRAEGQELVKDMEPKLRESQDLMAVRALGPAK